MSLKVDIREKSFRSPEGRTVVLRNIAFGVDPGQIVCLYGPSACGKLTLLRCIARLDNDFDGRVALNGDIIQGPSHLIGMTVQTDASYGWLTVEENITFGLRYMRNSEARGSLRRLLGRTDPMTARREARRLASIVGLSERAARALSP